MMELSKIFPNRSSEVLDIASELRELIMNIFPSALITTDKDNMGFGFGKGYKYLVFVISPYKEHVNLGIANGASLNDPSGLMTGSGKVHRHVKITNFEQLQDPQLKELMLAALRSSESVNKS